jgi:hypothetical protein
VQGADRDAVIDFSVRPVTDENGAVELIIPEGRDITRLSERDRQLRVTNRFLRHNIRNKLTTIQGHSKLISEVDDERVQSSGTKIAEAAADLDETAEMARNIHELIEADPTPATVDLVEQLDRAVADVRARSPHADLSVDAPASLEVTGLPSLNRAVAELLMIVLTNATSDRPTVRIDARESDTGAVEITTGDARCIPAVVRAATTQSASRSKYSGVWPALCGVTRTFSNPQSGWSSGRGSGSVTSSAAPRTELARSAPTRASETSS